MKGSDAQLGEDGRLDEDAQLDEVDRILQDWRHQRPDLDPSPMGVFGRIARLAARNRQSLTQMLSGYDLTPASFDVLANLRRSEPPHRKTPTELASSSMMSTGGMTFRVDKLESAGLVKRFPRGDDRRTIQVELTKKGRVLIDRVIEAHLERERAMLETFDADEIDALARLLARLERGIAS